MSSSPADDGPNALSDSVAIVTGSAQGIGLGVAEALVSAGCSVALFDKDEEGAATAADRLSESGIAVAYGVDLTSPESVSDAVAAVVESQGPVQILVNNAGVITGPTDVDELSERDWDWVVGTNTKSQFLTCRAVVPHMKEAGYGRIVNIASRSWLGVAGRVHYAASKGAVVSFTRSLALELGRDGITANCVSPTLVLTPLFAATPKEDQENVMRRVRAQPIPRPGTPEDIANAVLFFVDPKSSYITGQHLYVGGGADLMSSTP